MGNNSAEYYRTGQGKAGQNRTVQEKTKQNSTGQDRAGQVGSWREARLDTMLANERQITNVKIDKGYLS